MRLTEHKRRLPRLVSSTMCLMMLGFLLPASADTGGLNLNKTRLIFSADAGQATVVVNNTSALPYLVTSRVSRTVDGRETSPLFVSPPLFRLDGRSSNMLRVTGDVRQLPTDRESVFYLNVSGIPKLNPLSREDRGGFVSGRVAYSIGNIIKVFYRPSGLNGTPDDAARHLIFTRMANGVQARNDSPYYVSLQTLTINGRKVKFDARQPEMVSPFSTVTYPNMAAFPVSRVGEVTWSAVDDLGGVVSAKGTVQ